MVHRADDNQRELVDFMRAVGCSVLILSQVGNGCPDLLVGWKGQNYLFEVKTETGRLSDRQKDFKECWRGKPPVVIRNIEDVVEWLNK